VVTNLDLMPSEERIDSLEYVCLSIEETQIIQRHRFTA
jgi:hypothetical protein